MRQERNQNKIDILNNWLGTNADKKYIDKLIKEHHTTGRTTSQDKTEKSLSHQEARKEWNRLASTLGKLGLG